MLLERASGILLHPTSLPNGVLDEHAFAFVDWLAAAGQSWWQVLPLGPPEGLTGSPYMSPSAFAGSPGILADSNARVTEDELDAFRSRNAYWLDDWLDHGGTVADQVRFEREWQALRAYAAERGVRLFGDMPIYVAQGGADHLAHRSLFQQGAVAGVPPDLFAPTGQLWGNPLYDWTAMRADGYRWWIERFRRTFDLVDLTRVDHFRGFVSYWAVPEGEPTAEHGRWRRGPGSAVFEAVERELGELAVVAEDLGVITRAGRPAAARARLPRHGRSSVRARPRPDQSPPAREPRRSSRSSIRARMTTTPLAAGGIRSPTPTARWTGLDPADPAWSLIEVALALARGARSRAAAGRPRPRKRRPDEPARHRGRQLALALRAGAADGRARAAAARAHGLSGTPTRSEQ